MLTADVDHGCADDCFTMLVEHLPEADVALIRLEGVEASDTKPQRGWLASDPESLAWAEVVAEARDSSRLLGRYLALMAVAGVVAGIGVIEASGILIIGAMAISPDLLPLAAACVGLQQRRWRLFLRSLSTLLVGLAVGTVTAGLSALVLRGLDEYSGRLAFSSLSSLTHTDATTIMVALAAGVAAMLTYETKAGAAVGVAISVTTIPASAYLGVLVFSTDHAGAGGALGVLLTNIGCLLVGGTLTVVVQSAWRRRRSPVPRPLR
jgi:uncharacterized hydrophobic protein (TIGR00271 family)